MLWGPIKAKSEIARTLVNARSAAAARTCWTVPRCDVDSWRGAKEIATNKSPVSVAAASAVTVNNSREDPTIEADSIGWPAEDPRSSRHEPMSRREFVG